MRDECIGIPPRFHCELCTAKFRRKYHLVRHKASKHGIPNMNGRQNYQMMNDSKVDSKDFLNYVAKNLKNELFTNPCNFLPMANPSAQMSEDDSLMKKNVERFAIEEILQQCTKNNALLNIKMEGVVDGRESDGIGVGSSSEVGENDNDNRSSIVEQYGHGLQQSYQNLKTLFVNYAINNIPNT